MVEVKRVDILSVAMVVAAIYGVLGLVFGIIFACIWVFASATFIGIMADAGFDATGGIGGIAIAIGYAVCLPIIYAIMGFIGGAIAAAVYNLVARFVGGIKLELSGDFAGKV
jgi:hypothetical protein